MLVRMWMFQIYTIHTKERLFRPYATRVVCCWARRAWWSLHLVLPVCHSRAAHHAILVMTRCIVCAGDPAGGGGWQWLQGCVPSRLVQIRGDRCVFPLHCAGFLA